MANRKTARLAYRHPPPIPRITQPADWHRFFSLFGLACNKLLSSYRFISHPFSNSQPTVSNSRETNMNRLFVFLRQTTGTLILAVLTISLLVIFLNGGVGAIPASSNVNSVASSSTIVDTTDTEGQSKVIQVPYLTQGYTQWCFQTSLAMVLRYFGKDVLPADIALVRNQQPRQTVGLLDLLSGWADSYVSQWSELSFREDPFDSWSWEQYKTNIDANHPVIVSSFGFPGHTVVVVGYMEDSGSRYLYIHDPSGYLSQWKWHTGRIAFVKVPWSKFSGFFWPPLLVVNSVVVSP